MGWTYTQKPANVKQDLRDACTFTNNNVSYRVLDDALVNMREYYAAVERTDSETGDVRVLAFVTMVDYVRNDYYSFGTKEMTEEEGPVISNCPEKILKLLTPTDVEYANDWRARCWENVNARKRVNALKTDDVVRLENPVSFTNGEEAKELRVVTYAVRRGRRRKGYVTERGTLVRLPLHQYKWEKA